MIFSVLISSILLVEGYYRRNDPENNFRPTNMLKIIDKLKPIFYNIGTVVAELFDFNKLIELMKKYLPFEDLFNIVKSIWFLIYIPFCEFLKGFTEYYNNSKVIIQLIYKDIPFFTLLLIPFITLVYFIKQNEDYGMCYPDEIPRELKICSNEGVCPKFSRPNK
jgi:hypothetical protein